MTVTAVTGPETDPSVRDRPAGDLALARPAGQVPDADGGALSEDEAADRWAAGSTESERIVSDRRIAVAVRDLTIIMVLGTVGQRLALPITRGDSSVSMTIPVWLFLLARGLRTGVYVFDRRRMMFTLVALGGLVFATLFSVLGDGMRLTSLALMFPTYLPFMVKIPERGAEVFRKVVDRYLWIAAALSVCSLVQFGIQFIGVSQPDPEGSLIPSSWLIQAYNTIYPWYYGSPYIKSNCFFFLEPSFAAQFLGLAVVIHLWQRRSGLLPVLYLAGMVVTVAGTGYLLLAAGVVALAFTGRWRRVGRLVPLGVAGVVIGALSPVGKIIVGRIHEGHSSTTSTGLRWVTPFQDLGGHWLSSGWHSVVGFGPGSGTTYLAFLWGGRNPVMPLPFLKLLFEYGLVGALPFFAFMLYVSFRHVPCLPVAFAMLFAWALLSAGLLEAFIVAPMWALSTAVARSEQTAPVLFAVPRAGLRAFAPSQWRLAHLR